MVKQDDNYYGEIATSKLLPSLEVVQFGMDRVVYSHNICMEDYKEAKSGWQYAKEAINSGKYQLIILDELNICIDMDYRDKKEVASALDNIKEIIEKNTPKIRFEVGKQIRLRLTPELKFVYTDSLEKGSRVNEIIDKISRGEI